MFPGSIGASAFGHVHACMVWARRLWTSNFKLLSTNVRCCFTNNPSPSILWFVRGHAVPVTIVQLTFREQQEELRSRASEHAHPLTTSMADATPPRPQMSLIPYLNGSHEVVLYVASPFLLVPSTPTHTTTDAVVTP